MNWFSDYVTVVVPRGLIQVDFVEKFTEKMSTRFEVMRWLYNRSVKRQSNDRHNIG